MRETGAKRSRQVDRVEWRMFILRVVSLGLDTECRLLYVSRLKEVMSRT